MWRSRLDCAIKFAGCLRFSQKVEEDDGGHAQDWVAVSCFIKPKSFIPFVLQKAWVIFAQVHNCICGGDVGITAVFEFAENFLPGQFHHHIDFLLVVSGISEIAKLRGDALIEGNHVLIDSGFHHGSQLGFI